MTKPLGSRTKHGWLTAHALASGLREQYAHEMGAEKRVAQLTCTPKPTPTYVVEYTVNGALEQTWSFTNLHEARARYTALVHRAKRPLKEGASS